MPPLRFHAADIYATMLLMLCCYADAAVMPLREKAA